MSIWGLEDRWKAGEDRNCSQIKLRVLEWKSEISGQCTGDEVLRISSQSKFHKVKFISEIIFGRKYLNFGMKKRFLLKIS